MRHAVVFRAVAYQNPTIRIYPRMWSAQIVIVMVRGGNMYPKKKMWNFRFYPILCFYTSHYHFALVQNDFFFVLWVFIIILTPLVVYLCQTNPIQMPRDSENLWTYYIHLALPTLPSCTFYSWCIRLLVQTSPVGPTGRKSHRYEWAWGLREVRPWDLTGGHLTSHEEVADPPGRCSLASGEGRHPSAHLHRDGPDK